MSDQKEETALESSSECLRITSKRIDDSAVVATKTLSLVVSCALLIACDSTFAPA